MRAGKLTAAPGRAPPRTTSSWGGGCELTPKAAMNTPGKGCHRSLRARVDAGEGGEVRRDVLGELRARERPAGGGGLGELVSAVAALEDRDDSAGAADGGDGEELLGGPAREGRARVRVG